MLLQKGSWTGRSGAGMETERNDVEYGLRRRRRRRQSKPKPKTETEEGGGGGGAVVVGGSNRAPIALTLPPSASRPPTANPLRKPRRDRGALRVRRPCPSTDTTRMLPLLRRRGWGMPRKLWVASGRRRATCATQLQAPPRPGPMHFCRPSRPQLPTAEATQPRQLRAG